MLGRRGRKEEARLPTLLTVEHHGRRARPFVARTPNQSSYELARDRSTFGGGSVGSD